MAVTTLGRTHRAARLSSATRNYFNSPPEALTNWGQINPNLKDYHFNQMKNGGPFWILDITSWCISNKPSFCQEHPGVSDGPDSSDGTSYPVTENQTRPVAYLPCGGSYTMPFIFATHRIVYYTRCPNVRLPLLCVRNVVTHTHDQNDTYVTLFAEIHLRCSHLPNA
jgi:hypothetical protein